MRKKLAGGLLATAMVTALMAGCGKKTTTPQTAPKQEEVKQEAEVVDEVTEEEIDDTPKAAPERVTVSDDGMVLNILCWNDKLIKSVTDYYPDYEKIDDITGKIGDVEVHWIVISQKDDAYENELDIVLPGNVDALPEDKIDLFFVEADDASKYANSYYTLEVVNDIGVAEALLDNQYPYTKDIMTDVNGALRGVTWQGNPGVMVYRRDIAKRVWGTDDPEEIQSHFGGWEDFYAAADELKAKGYQITATVHDTYRVYSNNVSSKWVKDGKINIDSQMQDWALHSKELVENGCTSTDKLQSDSWKKGLETNSKVFCYFLPEGLMASKMNEGEKGMAATDGLYAAIKGPQSFFWGGTWLCGADGTDNISLVRDIMEKMTTDETILTNMAKTDEKFVNNRNVMEDMAENASYKSELLGGQNAIVTFCESADAIFSQYLSQYDEECNKEFQAAMRKWFDGKYASYDEAVEAFYAKVIEKYPELTK